MRQPDDHDETEARELFLNQEIDSLRATVERLEKEKAGRCEHCGGNNIYAGPPDCSGCGAPVCCQTCCKMSNLEALVSQLTKEKEEAVQEAALQKFAREQQHHDLTNLLSMRNMEVEQCMKDRDEALATVAKLKRDWERLVKAINKHIPLKHDSFLQDVSQLAGYLMSEARSGNHQTPNSDWFKAALHYAKEVEEYHIPHITNLLSLSTAIDKAMEGTKGA